MPRIFQSLIQSDFGSGPRGNLEAVIVEGQQLVHWFRDDGDPGVPWRRAHVVATELVAAPAGLIQSDFRSGDHGNFEVVVPIRAGDGVELWHFFHDNSDVTLPWQRGQLITTAEAAPASLIQSDFRSGDHGNFEVVVPIRAGDGVELWHFFHDNSDVTLPWQRGQLITTAVAGPATLIQTLFPYTTHCRSEVVVPIRAGDGVELWHFFHDNSDVTL